jgi:periplasmic divalent cation tolerance protein
MSLIIVRITCPDRETARRIAAILVAERLAACAHLGAEIESTYWWQGRVETARETPLLLNTRAALFDATAARVRALHPYELPAIVGHPIEATGDYAAWVAAETRAV